jgi:hypothetical protein
MNPRLRQLMLEAGYAAPEMAGRAQRLAELVVAECVQQVVTGVKTNPPQAEPPELVQILARRIQQHLGAEL